jgi:hypothetical protein
LGRRLRDGDGLTVVLVLEAGGCGVAGAIEDAAVEAAVVEPLDVAERRELDVVEARARGRAG